MTKLKIGINRHIGVALIALIACLFPMQLKAQDDGKEEIRWYNKVRNWVSSEGYTFDGSIKTTHTKYLMKGGRKGIIDEYISPIAHKGWQLGASFLTDYATQRDRKWHLYQELSVCLSDLSNAANGSKMYALALQYSLGPSWRVLSTKGFSIDLSPLFALNLGGAYKPSNTNNVANAKMSFGIEGWSRLRYQLPWNTMPIAISYTVQSPLIQCVFHPEYGQSYYDYVSGENGNRIKMKLGTPLNTIGIRQRLLVDLPIHNLTITFGAEHRHIKQEINRTTYQSGSWGVLFGCSVDLMCLSGNRAIKSKDIHNTLFH